MEQQDIDCELLQRLWKESGIVGVKNSGNRMRKWMEIAWKYNSERAPAYPVDVQALQSEWHEMITRRGSTFLQTGLAFSSVADGSQMICDRRFCDSVADLLVNLGQFW